MPAKRKKKVSTKVPVLFRMMRGEHAPLALFPTLPGTNERHTCTSYEHMGQHGSADLRGCMNSSRPAKPSEYAPLAKELRRIGYKLEIKKRSSYAMDKLRYAELKR